MIAIYNSSLILISKELGRTNWYENYWCPIAADHLQAREWVVLKSESFSKSISMPLLWIYHFH